MPARQQALAVLLITYISLQLLLPFRHFLYRGDSNWTEEGHFFAWHMMLREKTTGIRFMVTDPHTKRTGPINLRPYLDGRQLDKMGRDPEMILEFSHFLAADLREKGIEDVEVRVIALSSLNGRKAQLLIDPTVDLTKQQQSIWHKPWIVPLHEPFRETPWDVPLLEWERHVETTLPPGRRP